MEASQIKTKLPLVCPVCGTRTDHLVEKLKEGATLICPFCHLKLILHGHMWKAVKEEIDKLRG
jgi:hypothetical protein